MSKPNFWQELKRRNVYRVAVTYAMTAWLLIQVASIMLPTFEIQDWALRLLIIILIIGFPIALVLAWIYEMGPSGIIKTPSAQDISPSEVEANKKPFISNIVIGVLLVALISQFAYFKWLAGDIGPSAVIRKELKTERIAVVPFENLTNDPSYENIGKIAANFINLALMEIEDAEVVSPSTIASNLSAIGILPGDPANRTSFNDLTGASLMIAGNYFLNDGQLTLALQLQNTLTGKVQFALPHIIGDPGDMKTIISNATDNVLGYWAAKDLVDSRRIKLPNLEAYSLFLNRAEVGFSYERLAEILSLDSTFYLARIEWLNHARWLVHDSKPEHFQFLEWHLSDLTNYEQALFDYVKNLYRGNSQTTFKIVNSLWERFPKDFGLNHDAAGIAFDELNNHELSISIYDKLPLDEFDNRTLNTTPGRIRNEIVSRAVLYGPESLSSTPLSEKVYDINWSEVSSNFIPSLYAIMKTDEELYLEIIEKEFGKAVKAEEIFARLRSRFEWDYKSVFSTSTMNAHLIEKSRNLLNQFNEGGLERAIVAQIIRVLEEKAVVFEPKWKPQKNVFNPYAPYHRYLYWTALGKIQTNDLEAVYQIIQELESYVAKDLTLASSYAAFPYYHIGCIYAKMGDQENAIYYLQKARDMGLYAGHYQFNYDKHLETLYDHPKFRQMVAPIWPK